MFISCRTLVLYIFWNTPNFHPFSRHAMFLHFCTKHWYVPTFWRRLIPTQFSCVIRIVHGTTLNIITDDFNVHASFQRFVKIKLHCQTVILTKVDIKSQKLRFIQNVLWNGDCVERQLNLRILVRMARKHCTVFTLEVKSSFKEKVIFSNFEYMWRLSDMFLRLAKRAFKRCFLRTFFPRNFQKSLNYPFRLEIIS